VVLHGGATAVFRVASLGEAARLAEAVANVTDLEGSGALLTMADDHLSVRLTRGVFRLEEPHIGLARAVSATARAQGALGYAPLAGDNAVDPLGHGSTVWMHELDPAKPLRHAMRVDVSIAREHAEERGSR
jgi:4a-hydroxytetrahydrobiopterin dehydratase